KTFTEKQDRVVFRGKVYSKQQRVDFMNRFFGNPMFDAGDVGRDARPEWTREKLTIAEHLDFKFIMAIEGNDVASNLKWIMSSNSIAVMPRPTYETWFMEGTLIPDVHYIEVKPDFSDLVERVEYYMAHPDAAQKIIDNANRYAAQFTDKKREKLISLAVLDKYFRCTGQK
ncbi:MAG: lipopolysaccharide biosynthesis protein, partial [Muribaculaceae bacterium]|nr:lipopolysaccharide biosynthesis protein [Muribaculaceae bacterium]